MRLQEAVSQSATPFLSVARAVAARRDRHPLAQTSAKPRGPPRRRRRRRSRPWARRGSPAARRTSGAGSAGRPSCGKARSTSSLPRTSPATRSRRGRCFGEAFASTRQSRSSRRSSGTAATVCARDLFDLSLVIEHEPAALRAAARFLVKHRAALLHQLDERAAVLKAQFEAIDVLRYKPRFEVPRRAPRPSSAAFPSRSEGYAHARPPSGHASTTSQLTCSEICAYAR